MVMHTSGSTGVFKGVFRSRKNLVTSSITAIFTPDVLYIAHILNYNENQSSLTAASPFGGHSM